LPYSPTRRSSYLTLIWSKRAIEADPEAAINLDLAFVVLPGHTKYDLSFRLADTLDNFLFGIFGVFFKYWPKCIDYFSYRLVKLRFSWIAPDDLIENGFDTCFDRGIHFG